MKVLRLALLKNRSPAFLWVRHSSPSALMIPFPEATPNEHHVRTIPQGSHISIATDTGTWSRGHIPNRSQDLDLKKSPLTISSLFFS